MNYLPACTSRFVVQHLYQVSFKSMQGCRRSWEDKLWRDGMTDKANTKCPLAILWQGHKKRYSEYIVIDRCLNVWNWKIILEHYVFVKHGYSWQWQSQNLLVLHFDPASPQGHVTSVKCEHPIDELIVQVWLLYDHPNFQYCTLHVSGRNYGQTEGSMIQLLDATSRPSRPGA